MMTYLEAVSYVKKQLQDAGIVEYEADALWLFMELFHMNRTQYFLRQRDVMPDDECKLYLEAANKRAQRIPLQYIVGYAYFMGLTFKTTPAVLIPRQDTECLVEEVEKLIAKKNQNESVNVLDMCTGSGCIALSLAVRNHNVQCLAADLSEDALEVARINKETLQCERVTFIQSDLFERVDGTFDIVVSNPPYIRTEVIKGLMEEVKDHEPYMALDGLEDGLHFYRKITEQAMEHLNAGGYLCYEIGHDQGQDVVDIMQQHGFMECLVMKDLAGLDRVVIGKKL